MTTIQDNQAQVKKAIENPDAIHFKGVTLSPTGSFIAAETVWRSGATGGGINTQFTGVPLNHSDAAQLSEFYGSGRQSRVALKAIGKLDNMTLTGYYEADWLGTGSYLEQQRVQQLRDAAAPDLGAGGSEQRLDSLPAARCGPLLPRHHTAWTMAPRFFLHHRLTIHRRLCMGAAVGLPRHQELSNNQFFIGASAENPQTLNPAGSSLPLNRSDRFGWQWWRPLRCLGAITPSISLRTSSPRWPTSRSSEVTTNSSASPASSVIASIRMHPPRHRPVRLL